MGEDRGHCVRCCQTWDDGDLFDAHRPGEVCLTGAELGLLSSRNGIWLRPLERLEAAS